MVSESAAAVAAAAAACRQLFHLPKINIKTPLDGRGRMIRINICIFSFAFLCVRERVCPRSIGWRVGVCFGYVSDVLLRVVIDQQIIQDRFATPEIIAS